MNEIKPDAYVQIKKLNLIGLIKRSNWFIIGC